MTDSPSHESEDAGDPGQNPAEELIPDSGVPKTVSRRRILRGAAAAAGGLTVAAAGGGMLGHRTGIPFLGGAESARAFGDRCLVLYDDGGSGDPYGWIGDVHSKLLTNLLGRFTHGESRMNRTVRKPMSQYAAGDTERYEATFYIGSSSGSVLPAAFKNDFMATSKPVVWFRYNIDQVAWGTNKDAFQSRFGLRFDGNTTTEAKYQTYSQVNYKSRSVLRNSAADPVIGWMNIITPTANRQVVATVSDPVNTGNAPIPYITRSGNFWYVADNPFSYISEEDRFLVIADVLFDVLDVRQPQRQRALVRLEDVSAHSNPDELLACANYLASVRVPFSIALIPIYKDPLGTFNGGQPRTIPISQAPAVLAAVNRMVELGGQIVMHGTTHQYSNVPNPFNAVSAADYEFYRVTENPDGSLNYVGPIPGDSAAWCSDVLDQGRAELRRAGLKPFAFTTPHYTASAIDYQVIGRTFNCTYQRVNYFEGPFSAFPPPGVGRDGDKEDGRGRGRGPDGERGGPGTRGGHGVGGAGTAPAPVHFGGEFFPYVINGDVYGQKVIPENLGCVLPPTTRLPADIIRAAKCNLVVRDAFASFFYHPPLGVPNLQEIVQGITNLGYRFVRASSL